MRGKTSLYKSRRPSFFRRKRLFNHILLFHRVRGAPGAFIDWLVPLSNCSEAEALSFCAAEYIAFFSGYRLTTLHAPPPFILERCLLGFSKWSDASQFPSFWLRYSTSFSFSPPRRFFLIPPERTPPPILSSFARQADFPPPFPLPPPACLAPPSPGLQNAKPLP